MARLLDFGASTDESLLDNAREGDEHSYATLFRRHKRSATLFARRYARTPEGTEDLVSEAFARVFATLKRGGGPSSGFRSYLHTTIRRIAIDGYAKTDPEVTIDDFGPIEGQLESLAQAAPRHFGEGVVGDAFLSLPQRWQEVLWLVDVEGYPVAQVAELMQMTPNSLSALLYRAREGLKSAYLEYWSDPAELAAEHSTRKELALYVRGKATRQTLLKVEQHLGVCQSCSERAESLQHMKVRLSAWLPGAILAPIAGTLLAIVDTGRQSALALGRVAHSLGHSIGSATKPIMIGAGTLAGTAATVTAVVVAVAVTPQQGTEIQAEPAPEPITAPAKGLTPVTEQPTTPIPTSEPDPPADNTNDIGLSTVKQAKRQLPTSTATPTAPSRDPQPEPDAVQPDNCTATVLETAASSVLGAYTLTNGLDGTEPDYSDNQNPGSYHPAPLFDGGLPGVCGPGQGALHLTGGGEYLATANNGTAPEVFTVQIWFRTETGGGRLIGFGDAPQGDSQRLDRHLYLTSSGHVVFGVDDARPRKLQSPQSYLDGQWHQATGTLSPTGMTLYIDGEAVSSNSSITAAADYDGYWRVGADNLANWGESSNYAGWLSYAATYEKALSATQIRTQYLESTAQ